MEVTALTNNPAVETGVTAWFVEYFGMTPAELVYMVLLSAIMLGGYLLVHRSYLKRVGKSWASMLHPRSMLEIDYNKREWLILGALFALWMILILLVNFLSAWWKYR